MIEEDSYRKFCLFEGELVGGKAEQLIKLSHAGFNIPEFRVIPAEYYVDIIQDVPKIKRADKIMSLNMPQHDKELIDNFVSTDKYYSIRSSAVGEDGKEFSFAGLFESYLFVSPTEIVDKLKGVWKSGLSERIAFYRKQNRIETDIKIAVIIQEMIDAEISGVMFGINPISQKEGEMLISATYGLGEGLVSGELNADNYYIFDDQLVSSDIAEKNQALHQSTTGSGTIYVNVEEDKAKQPALESHHISALTHQLNALNQFYNYPQDVEWAIASDEIFILQSRPITNLKPKEGSRIIWDNSNIIESYPGVTTPLTFSFIREMYKVVYVQFSELLGIDENLLKKNEDVYENMLGLIRGRVYYNLRSWYRALALLPGYKLNANFMETMMGVKEKFDLEDEYRGSKTRARLKIVKTVFKMIKSFRSLPRDRDQFLAFLDKTVAEYKKINFEDCHPEELMDHYKTFEKVLTEKWQPPLVNDFFTMIYFGVFQKLIARWIADDHPHLHNDLLSSSNDIISTQPMIKSLEIAKEILSETNIKKDFERDPFQVWKDLQMGKHPAIHEKIRAYLYKYGERCLGELKLETISYNQAPEEFIKILQSYIDNPAALSALDKSNSLNLRDAANLKVKSALKGKFFKKSIFNYFLRKTRELVSNRENLRFERTRGFGIVREIFSAMGVQFEKRNLIDHHRDIFYLTKEEIFDFISGTSLITELKQTISLRKGIFQHYKTDDYVPERITTYGVVNEDLVFKGKALEIEEGDITGIACCPGIVEAEVCVIHSPDQIKDLKGRIMVTSSTDPGWVSLFPTASGILVERGSLLSHSAIVARELGIPCIVAINSLLSRLKTGDNVIMDGSTGVVKLKKRE